MKRVLQIFRGGNVNGWRQGENRRAFCYLACQNAPSAHLSELYFCYSEIEAYCLKIKVLRKPLFETIDLDIIKRVQKTVTESRIFQLSHKKQMRKIVTAAQYYKAFVKSLVAQETNTTELSISQTMGDISSDGKPCEVTQRKEIALSENKKEDNVLIIDFAISIVLHIQSQFHFHTLGMNRLVSLIGRNYM